MAKITVGFIFGGRSVEHEAALNSAWTIFKNFDRAKYKISLIGIDKRGFWHYSRSEKIWIDPHNFKKIRLDTRTPKVTAVNKNGKVYLIKLVDGKPVTTIDVFFLKTSGTFGEDGSLQGFFELLDVPYIGAGVLGSAIGMDKDVMKRLLRDAGINVAKFYAFAKVDWKKDLVTKAIRYLKFPIFVKPANLGSSVGISKVKNRKQLEHAMKYAFEYDNKIILEETIVGREIECGVLGNEKPMASVPSEIKLPGDYFSYDLKYIHEDTVKQDVRANLSKREVDLIQKTSIKVFKVLNIEGMCRVDYFFTKSGKLFVNEINTLPAFSKTGLYPLMFAESGIPYPKLLDELVRLAFERKKRNDKLKRVYRFDNN